MTIESELEKKAQELAVSSDTISLLNDRIEKLLQHLSGAESFKVAKIWKTTPVATDGVGDVNQFDAITLVHTSVSERDLAETFYQHLEDISDSEIVNKAVKVNIENIPFNVVPTKFAQQGTIGLGEGEYLDFADIIGADEMFASASRLLQHWQYHEGLDLETQTLLPYEIEFTLAHLVHEYEPTSLKELIELFFKFGEAERFATQLNIFDKHDNILLYHNFIIPDKQLFLETLFEGYNKFVSDDPNLSIFGI